MSSTKKIAASLLLLFLSTLLIYRAIYPNPRNWYNHYYHLSQSFIQGQLSVPTLPEFYHDTIVHKGNTYLPFPPTPALLLVPANLAGLTQQQTSILVGAINTPLTFLLTGSLPLSLFFAFGTVHFTSSVLGTTWFYAHITSILFVLLALLAHKSKKNFLAGLLLGLAILARLPVIAAAIFFFLESKGNRKTLVYFLTGLITVVFFYPLYNYLRFSSPFQSGYLNVYQYYISSNIPYTFFHSIFPAFPHFHHLDPRNIPLHLYTFLIQPPLFQNNQIVPSPYGMGILFTSPLLLIALLPRFKHSTERHAYLAALTIAIIDFSHFAQGWVQFGYRFILDFLPFLLIILSFRFKPNKLHHFLLLVSIFVTTWGTLQAIKLGW